MSTLKPENMIDTCKTGMRGLAGRVHKAGYPFIAAAGLITLVLLWTVPFIGLLAAILTGWMIYFFRDPVRVVPEDDSLIIAPADGRIQAVTKAAPPAELTSDEADSEGYTRISIFLDLFDVHVNRLPVTGHVEKRVYTPGQFLNAAMDKASDKNERCGLRIKRNDSARIYVVQIAGLVARRIICDTDEGDQAVAGRRFGIIRFGSRVDVYIPAGFQPRVAPGQRAIGGETVLAMHDSQTQNLQTRQE